jgi:hypothetical protein
MSRFFPAVVVLALVVGVAALSGQRRDAFVANRDDPAIAYSKGPVSDEVAALNARLVSGAEKLAYDEKSGYLPAVLKALHLPVSSQALVFSQTSFQAPLINIHNPRAVFFNDNNAVGWVRGGEVLEVASVDPRQGVVFYALKQERSTAPRFTRNDQCLACHLSWDTLGVPGYLLESTFPLPDDPNAYANGFFTVQGSLIEQRFGGWWVTGDTGGATHMGNIPVMPEDKKFKMATPLKPLPSVQGLFDLSGYQSPYSDIVAQLVLAHQTRMTNLITRTGWEARLAAEHPSADATSRVRDAATDLVDYLLFVDEAPLSHPVHGTSGFVEQFAAIGPKDPQGRSLRDFDLQHWVFKYPCSYMIYSKAFDALPPAAKSAVYARMQVVLAGRDPAPRYKRLTAADRRAVLDILKATKSDLPAELR